ncbi:MAG: DNA repair protein RecN [Chloroflexi bacterium]|nr:DNA repair protein RecN [Chloroflexota bacterium]
MLLELTISNLAIIEFVRLGFSTGFSVLTGETGAGKSIIIDAVTLLLGGRASADMIRTGSDAAYVEGVFSLEPRAQKALGPLLDEGGLRDDDGDLIIRREILRTRRSVCRVNGRTVPLSTLEELGSHLIDIHGQGDHLSLLQPRTHVGFLDRYGGLQEHSEAVGRIVRELRSIRSRLEDMQRDQREIARRVDLLNYQTEEIAAAALAVGEDTELAVQRILLSNAEQRLHLAAQIYQSLTGAEERPRAALDQIGEAMELLSDLCKLDGALREEKEMLDSAYYQVEELARSIRSYRDDIEIDTEALAAIEDRLALIRGLKLKYGDSIEEIIAFGERARAELDAISHSEEEGEALHGREAVLLDELSARASELSTLRREAAARLSAEVEAQLDELNMPQARFIVDLRHEPAADGSHDGVLIGGERLRYDLTGVDRVEFLIAPNPGEAPQPLARIASGGETSRLMLAMKSVLSAADATPTLIFDEIDAGIGGHTGDVVGRKLWRLARDHQVFCVTHLAQIARFGTQHVQVAKQVVDDRTYSVARPLSYEERVEELAIMLGGAATDSHRRSALELLQEIHA